MQTNLSRWFTIDTNEPDIKGLHFNGYVWEYAFVPYGIYPVSPSDCIVREWFHPSEGWK
jgi:hypothetical protein